MSSAIRRRKPRTSNAPKASRGGAAQTIRTARYLSLELSAVVQKARKQSGLTQRALAAEIFGVPKRDLTKAWEQPAKPHVPNLLHIAVSPTKFARPLIDWLAERHGLEVLARAAVVHRDDNVARMNSVVRACANLPRALAAAVPLPPTLEQLDLFEREATTCAEVAREVKAYAIAAKRRLRDGSDA